MRNPSIFAIVVVAAASTAAAEPKHEGPSGRVRYGDQTEARNEPRDPPPPETGWVQLATPTPASHGTEFFVVGAEQGTFAKVRIDAARGAVEVHRVSIYFQDGKQKVVHVDSVLNARRPSAEIALGGAKAIDRIVVTTDVHTKGAYALYGSSGGAGVAAR